MRELDYVYHGVKQINQNVNFEKLLQEFVDYLDVKPATVRTYTKGIRSFLTFISAKGIAQPARNDILSYRGYLQDAKKKASTVQNYLIGVRRFFVFLEGSGYYPNVAKDVKSVKVSRSHKKDYLTAEQVNHVVKGIDQSTHLGRRNYALFLLMVVTGLRTIEVSRADIEDIRPLGGSIVLDIQGKGHDDKGNYVKLPFEVEKALRVYISERSNVEETNPLFVSTSNNSRGKRLNTRSVSGIVKMILRQAGLDSPRLTAHSLRHTTATLNLLGGGSLEETQQLLRHENLQTTMVYNHSLERANNKSEERVTRAIFQ